jgi:hypothetical protein
VDNTNVQVPVSLVSIKIPENRWSFFQALLGITDDQMNADILKQIRELASAITWCAATDTHDRTVEIVINDSTTSREKRVIKNIDLKDFIKLISIPNVLEPYVYLLDPTLHEIIGKYAAHIMGKRIIVVNDEKVIENYGDPKWDKIYLNYTRHDEEGEHYDVLEPPQITCSSKMLPINPFIEDFIQRGGKGPFNVQLSTGTQSHNVNDTSNWKFYQALLPNLPFDLKLIRQLACAITWRTLAASAYKPGLNRNISTSVNGTPMTITGTQFVKLMSVGFSEPCVRIDKDTLPLIGEAAADIIGKTIHVNGTKLTYGSYDDNLELESSSLSSGSTYTVKVVTGSESGSGTNSSVFITLIGQNGESNEFVLNRSIEHADTNNLFETNQTDTFNVVSNINIGKLHNVRVRIEGSGLGHEWFLDHIIVSGGGLANPVQFDSKLLMSDDQPIVELFPIPKSPKRIGEPSAKAQNVVAADAKTVLSAAAPSVAALSAEPSAAGTSAASSVPSAAALSAAVKAATSVKVPSSVPSAAQPGHPPQQYPLPNEEIQKMLNNADINIQRKAQFALIKYNKNYEEAIKALNPPSLTPAQVQSAYMKTPDYLKNPEIFVNAYVQYKSIPLLPNPVYEDDSNGRNLNAFSAIFHEWRVISTVGEGNCLTHAFLQCLSSTYGKITGQGYTNKSKVAQAFRLSFSSESVLARDKLEYEIGNGLVNLSDLQILDYSILFNVITVVFEQVVVNPSHDMANPIFAHNFHNGSKPNDIVIFIHADGGHYSSVMLPTGKFTMTLNDAQQNKELQKSLSIQMAPIPDA